MKDRVKVGLWLALGILAVNAVLTYRSIDAAADTLKRVEQTHAVLRKIDALSAAYFRAATARRAYVVAGDASQLSGLAGLDVHVALAVGKLRPLIADNPGQGARLDSLQELLQRRLADLDASVARRRTDGSNAESAAGLKLALQIQSVREAMDLEENTLLTERDLRTQQDMARTKRALLGGTGLSVAILLFAFDRLRREIARRRSSEEALRASIGTSSHVNRFLDSIVENLPSMIFVKEAAQLRFERINRAGEELLGVSREQLLDKNDFDFFPREQAETFQAADRATLTRAVVVDIAEEPIQTKTGERWLHTKKVPILDENGTPRYLLGISEDITDRRLAAQAFKAAKEAADSANRELESFSYSVAHDLRAPLRGIAGFSQALLEDSGAKLDDEGRGYLARVMASAKTMAELIDGLLTLSRITRGELQRDDVNLSTIAEGICARLHQEQPDRSVELVIKPGIVVEGDKRLLTAALENLLANAWKFTSKRPTARIEVGSLRAQDENVYFVRDDGAGFSMAYAEKLFGAFQRLHSSSEFEGTGIGLATVQRIIRRHRGRIWAEGVQNAGVTFYFTLATTKQGGVDGTEDYSTR